MKATRLIALLGFLAAFASMGWGQVTITGTGASYQITAGSFDGATISFSGGSLSGSLTASDTFSVVWNNPGTVFSIAVPTGVTQAYLEFIYSSGAVGSTLTFDSPVGTFLSPVPSGQPSGSFTDFRVSNTGASIRYVADLSSYASGTFSFNSFTASAHFTGASTETLSASVNSFYLQTSVPEPSTWAWGGTMLTAGMVTLWRRRRAAVLVA